MAELALQDADVVPRRRRRSRLWWFWSWQTLLDSHCTQQPTGIQIRLSPEMECQSGIRLRYTYPIYTSVYSGCCACPPIFTAGPAIRYRAQTSCHSTDLLPSVPVRRSVGGGAGSARVHPCRAPDPEEGLSPRTSRSSLPLRKPAVLRLAEEASGE